MADSAIVTSGAAQPTLSFHRDAGDVVLEFAGQLQSAPTVKGPWTDVTGAASPPVIKKANLTGTAFSCVRGL